MINIEDLRGYIITDTIAGHYGSNVHISLCFKFDIMTEELSLEVCDKINNKAETFSSLKEAVQRYNEWDTP